MIRESSHAASLRRKLIAIGKLTLPTNTGNRSSSSSSSLTVLTTEQRVSSPSLVCSPLSYAHPSMCATGIPDMGGGLGVVAINHNLESNDDVDDNISSNNVTSEAGISSQTSIMRVPVRGVVTGKSARRWIYQMILEASTHPKKNEKVTTVTQQGNVEQTSSAFPLLFECLRSYLVKGGNAPTTGGKEGQLPTNSSFTIEPVSINLEEKISGNATNAPQNEKAQLLHFLTRLEEWLLSLTSVQTIALFLFLMREVPAKYLDQITSGSQSGTDSKSEGLRREEDNEKEGGDAEGKKNSPLPYVIAEDTERHALLWEWVRNLPSQYDNLLELAVDSETTESDAGRSIDHFVWSPAYAAKVREEIAAWHTLFLSTMMWTTTTTQKSTATCTNPNDDDDDESSGEEILTSDEEDNDRAATKSKVNKLKNKPTCTNTYKSQQPNTSMPATAAAQTTNTNECTVSGHLDDAASTSPFTSFGDMLQSLFAVRSDLFEDLLLKTKDESCGINSIVESGEGWCRLALSICPRKFLWAYNSLMSRGFACDDETWVMMPYVDYFNYGFAEDETDEDDAIRYCKEMKAKTKSGAEKLKECVVGTCSNNAASVDSAQAKATTTNIEPDATSEVSSHSGRPAPHLCSNISVTDRIPSAEELLNWIYSSNNTSTSSSSSSTSTPHVLLPTSLSEIERLLDWSANAFSSTKRLWDLGAGTRYKALSSSSRKLRGEYLKQQVDGVLGTSGLNGSTKALVSGDGTFSSLAILCSNNTGGAQETLTWYQQAKKITAATAIIVPSYNPLSICEFTTTADVPFTNSLVAKGQHYHQLLLCYGTYMDQELALWYGFTLTAPGDEEVIVDPRGSAVLSRERPPQPLLRNHIGHSYSFSPLADACGDYPSDRPEQSYRRVAERFFASPLMMGTLSAETSTTLVTSEVIEKSLADFKESFKPYVCGGSSSSSKRGIRRGGGKGDYFVVGDGAYTNRDDGSGKRSLHSLRKALSNTSDPYSSHLTRLPSPHLFFSSTVDVFRNHFSDFRISKAGVTEEILEAIEYLATQCFTFSSAHSCEVHVMRTMWGAILGSFEVTPLEENAAFLIRELSEYQRVFNSRCGTYVSALSSTNIARVKVVPAPKRSRESLFGQKAQEQKGKSRSLCSDARENGDTICVSLSEFVSALSRQIPSFSPSVLLVALVLQNVAFSEWELLEKSRVAFIVSNQKNTERNGSPHSTMSEYFGLRASHVQWEMLCDISNIHANAQRTLVCEESKSTTMPLISLNHLMNLLYLCYDGRGRE